MEKSRESWKSQGKVGKVKRKLEKSKERKSAWTESVRKMYDGKGCVILGSKITTGEVNQEFTKQEKVISLFKFIEELNKFK